MGSQYLQGSQKPHSAGSRISGNRNIRPASVRTPFEDQPGSTDERWGEFPVSYTIDRQSSSLFRAREI
jgi:hypothetical protein